jgi:hypothetical protein
MLAMALANKSFTPSLWRPIFLAMRFSAKKELTKGETV